MDDLPRNNATADGWWHQVASRTKRLLTVFRHFWWVAFLTTAVGFAAGAYFVICQKPIFISYGRMMVSGRINLREGAAFSEDLVNFFGTQTELMKSQEVRRRAENRVLSRNPDVRPIPVAISVSQIPQTSIFQLSAMGSEPDYTQKILDAVMTEYVDTKREMRSSRSESTESAILDEISRVSKDVRESEEKLLNFQKQNNVGYLAQEGNSAAAYVQKLNRQLADLKTQYELFDTLDVDQVIQKIQNDPKKAGALAADSADPDSNSLFGNPMGPADQYFDAKQKLAQLKAQQAEFTGVLRPKHPEMVRLAGAIREQEMIISGLRSQSVDELKGKREFIKKQMDNLRSAIKEWDGKALSLSERLANYNQIKGDLDRSKSLYDRLINNLHDVDLTRNVDQDLISVLQTASPAGPIKPNMPQILGAGTVSGLLIGFAILFLIDQADDRVRSAMDVQSRFHEHVLGYIPTEKEASPLSPVQPNDRRHAFAEALKALRSSLLYLPVEGERPKTLLITSAAPGEGKSTIALNLAVTMALAKVPVLLVDADLRRGRLHEAFGRERGNGLSDFLPGQEPLENICWPTPVPNLDFVSQGERPGEPGDLFLSKRFNEFLREVYPRFEFIIFDSPPIMAADDTTSFAPKIDATLFVIRLSRSSARSSKKALDLLRDRQANVIGLICNDVAPSQQDYYQYRYAEYYQPKETILPKVG